jgi:hypothetical protein|tara:strand:- start:361 stop:1818 length:1458 start_codon:yes stop_codon:yes gene_type:complete
MIILGTNSVKDTGYDVANSCRFNAGDSDNMHKTPGSASNRRKFTFSCWIKKGDITPSADTCLFSGDNSDDNARPDDIRIKDTGKLQVAFRNTNDGVVSTKRVLRDPSAWMNIVVSIDTEQSTASNRVKIYINGVQETSLEGDGSGDPTYPSEDHDCTGFGRDTKITVGARSMDTPDKFFDGYLAEVVYIDGLQLAPTSFGEFDEDSPTIWKPIDVSELTFGTNGFYLDFEASDNLGNDANGGTDLTEVNLAATDSATDSPTNNFAIMNPLLIALGATVPALTVGNLRVANTIANKMQASYSNFAVSSGKWYVEIKMTAGTAFRPGISTLNIGQAEGEAGENQNSPGLWTEGWGYFYDDGVLYNDNGDAGGTYAAFAAGDIVSIGLDMDNSKLFFGVNGTWQNSADPAAGTNSIDISGIAAGSDVAFGAAVENSSAGATYSDVNFGSPVYANSSSAADGNGYGDFEYAPPSGFLALCTKNLGSTGG